MDIIEFKVDYYKRDGHLYTTEIIKLKNIFPETINIGQQIEIGNWVKRQIRSGDLWKENYAVCADSPYLVESFMLHPQTASADSTKLTLQDFRNELQELSFKLINRMNVTGDTYTSNTVGMLMSTLDACYGTRYQSTPSVIAANKKNLEQDDSSIGQLELF